jgi:hypothetical protein
VQFVQIGYLKIGYLRMSFFHNLLIIIVKERKT